ncbi:MAG: ion channel [Acidilobaceae archaeon]
MIVVYRYTGGDHMPHIDRFIGEMYLNPLVEVFIVYLVILSILIVIIDYTVSVPDDLRFQMYLLDLVVVLIIFVELLIRAYRSGSFTLYLIRHFYEVIALIPLYALYYMESSLTIAGLVRLLRLIRIVRIGILVGRSSLLLLALSKTLRRLHFSTIFSALALSVIVASISVYFVEASSSNSSIKSVWDALWWGIATVTTVGYGDVVPVTPLGKIIGVFLMLVGIGVFSAFVGLVASVLTRLEKLEEESKLADIKSITERLERIESMSSDELESLIRDIRELWFKSRSIK